MWFSKSQPRETPPEPFFDWAQADCAIGLPSVDQEHRELAQHMSEVYAQVQGRDRTQALRALEALIQETRCHFRGEEDTLAKAGYPDLEAHAAEHEALLAQADDLLRQFKAGTLSALALPNLLKPWLIAHIRTSDRKYAVMLKRQGFR